MTTVLLLVASNLFMTVAWYGHLKFKGSPLWKAILVSWLIAFLEYCLQVPANRIGSRTFSVTQLKIIQEVVTLVVFMGFTAIYFREHPKWNELTAFVLIIAAVTLTFWPSAGTARPL